MPLLQTHQIETYCAAGLVTVLAFAFATLNRRTSQAPRLPLPPGPKPLPIIGNLLDIPREKEWIKYHEWNQKYGDIVYVEALGQKIVVLGTADAVTDLMDRRGTIYSDRVSLRMLNEIMGFKWMLTFIPYGEHWRRSRKMLHPHFQAETMHIYRKSQLQAALRLVRDLLASPQTPATLPLVVRTNFAETITKVVYGIDLAKNPSKEYIYITERVLEALTVATLPGRFLVDYIHLLQYVPEWMPGAGFKKYARQTMDLHKRMRDIPANEVKNNMVKDNAPQSAVRSMLEDAAVSNHGIVSSEDEQLIKDIAGTLYLGGADTTVASVVAFFLAMLVYPDVQRKAQEEIDRVVGTARLPDFTDRQSLPYLSGVIDECIRWLPVGPLGVPHAAARDDEYNGYFIPKGSIVMGSTWAILHNPADYPNPETFNPERYLSKNPDGSWSRNPDIRDPRSVAFGFGRRICPGRFFADASLFATLATVLATIHVCRVVGLDGEEKIPVVDVTSGVLSHPKPFDYTIRARKTKALELIEAALNLGGL